MQKQFIILVLLIVSVYSKLRFFKNHHHKKFHKLQYRHQHQFFHKNGYTFNLKKNKLDLKFSMKEEKCPDNAFDPNINEKIVSKSTKEESSTELLPDGRRKYKTWNDIRNAAVCRVKKALADHEHELKDDDKFYYGQTTYQTMTGGEWAYFVFMNFNKNSADSEAKIYKVCVPVNNVPENEDNEPWLTTRCLKDPCCKKANANLQNCGHFFSLTDPDPPSAVLTTEQHNAAFAAALAAAATPAATPAAAPAATPAAAPAAHF